MNHVIFDGVDLTTFGLYVSGDKTFNSPEKNYTKVSIPGRSGDLYFSDGSFKNVKVRYNSILIENFDTNAKNLRNFMLSKDGYTRLEDDYHPDEFRMAVYSGPLEFDPIRLLAGTTVLEFNCRPERFLKDGENYSDMPSSGTITLTNPTNFTAKPLIKVAYKSNSAISINYAMSGSETKTLTIAKRNTNYAVVIDSELMECRTLVNGDSKNDLLTIDPFDFPVVPPNSTLSLTAATTSDYTYISVAPRWYIL